MPVRPPVTTQSMFPGNHNRGPLLLDGQAWREALGYRLRAARNRTGYTCDEVATILQVTTYTIRNWESGRYAPESPSLFRLGLLYRESIDALTGLDIHRESI